jgi:excinuclease UvrABC nuclease subunit
LLKYFGSVKKIKEASVEDLAKAASMSVKNAKKVLDFLATSAQ